MNNIKINININNNISIDNEIEIDNEDKYNQQTILLDYDSNKNQYINYLKICNIFNYDIIVRKV